METDNRYPRNFSRSELLSSKTATRRGITNEPFNVGVENNLVDLAHTLQNLRATIQSVTGVERAITVTSGYRCKELNEIVTGNKASRSRHMRGLAADISVAGMTPKEVVSFVMNRMPNLAFHKIINEYDQWVHISIPEAAKGEAPLRQYLNATRAGGRTVYSYAN